jgi:hypothetical protein
VVVQQHAHRSHPVDAGQSKSKSPVSAIAAPHAGLVLVFCRCRVCCTQRLALCDLPDDGRRRHEHVDAAFCVPSAFIAAATAVVSTTHFMLRWNGQLEPALRSVRSGVCTSDAVCCCCRVALWRTSSYAAVPAVCRLSHCSRMLSLRRCVASRDCCWCALQVLEPRQQPALGHHPISAGQPDSSDVSVARESCVCARACVCVCVVGTVWWRRDCYACAAWRLCASRSCEVSMACLGVACGCWMWVRRAFVPASVRARHLVPAAS